MFSVETLILNFLPPPLGISLAGELTCIQVGALFTATSAIGIGNNHRQDGPVGLIESSDLTIAAIRLSIATWPQHTRMRSGVCVQSSILYHEATTKLTQEST